MAQDVLLLIKTNQRQFTEKERKLAEFILNFPEKVIDMSITELSDTLNIGQGTIVRFCQKVGLSGFHPFKIALAKSIGQQGEAIESQDILTQVYMEHVKAIEETSKLLNERKDIVTLCAQKIANCRRLYLLGVGASGITALDAFYKFLRIGIDTRYTIDSHLQAMNLSHCNEKDCVLAFSQSGSTSVIVDMASYAKKCGACVIAITGYNRSPLTAFSDYVLLTSVRETPFQSGAIRSKIAQLHVLEVLFEKTRAILGPAALEATNKTAEAVEKWIY